MEGNNITVPEYVFDLPADKLVVSLNRRAASDSRKRKAYALRNAAILVAAYLAMLGVALIVLLSTLAFADVTESHWQSIGSEAQTSHEAYPQAQAAPQDPGWSLNDADFWKVCAAVNAVAGGEDYDAKRAVAASIRYTTEDFGLTVDEVIREYKYPLNYENISDLTVCAVYEAQQMGSGFVSGITNRTYFCFNPETNEDAAFFAAQQYAGTVDHLRFYTLAEE